MQVKYLFFILCGHVVAVWICKCTHLFILFQENGKNFCGRWFFWLFVCKRGKECLPLHRTNGVLVTPKAV